MPILTDADMGPFRQLFADLACDQECTIKRPSEADDGYGHNSEPSMTTIATVLVLVKKPDAGAMLQNYAMRIASQSVCIIDFPYGQDVIKNDRLIFTGVDKTFMVQEVLDPGSFSISTSVVASEVS